MDVVDAGATHAGAVACRRVGPRQGEENRGRGRGRPADALACRRRYRRVAAMSDKPRILVTGFGAFPGAPYNPTMSLVERLMRLRRPAFDDVKLSSHIFHVSYAAVDRELPKVLEKRRPHALLMFGLAQRTPYLRVETRARNAITTI